MDSMIEKEETDEREKVRREVCMYNMFAGRIKRGIAGGGGMHIHD